MAIQEKIDALKKEFETKIAELEKQAKAEEQKQGKVWKPKKGERYWSLCTSGYAQSSWDGDYTDIAISIRGNIFQTKEEAEWQDRHRIVETELKAFVQENDPRPITEEDLRDSDIDKYFVMYMPYDNVVETHYCWSCMQANQVYASNEEVLKKAIEHIGEERLKKYYFGVGK